MVRRWSAKPLHAGSIPAGVFCRKRFREVSVQRQPWHPRGFATSVPDMVSDRNSRERAGSMVEHQIQIWELWVRIPRQTGVGTNRRLQPGLFSHDVARGRRTFGNRPAVRFARPRAPRSDALQAADTAHGLLRPEHGDSRVEGAPGSPGVEHPTRPVRSSHQSRAQADLRVQPGDS